MALRIQHECASCRHKKICNQSEHKLLMEAELLYIAEKHGMIDTYVTVACSHFDTEREVRTDIKSTKKW